MTYQNIFIIQPDGNGHRDGNNPTGAGGGGGPRNAARIHIFGHSLGHYTGGDPAPWSTWTSTWNWMGHFANYNLPAYSAGGNFGQITTLNSDWDARGGPPTSINIDLVTNTIPYWDQGGFANEQITDMYFMASNFEQFDTTPNDYLARTMTLLDRLYAIYPNAIYRMYVHWSEPNISGSFADNANLTPSEFTTYNTYISTTYWQWHVDWFNLIRAARPLIDVRMVPVGPLIADLCENQAYMDTLAFNQFFGDDAPHGRELQYFLAAWVCFHDMYNNGANVSGFQEAVGADPWPSEVANNLESINTYFLTRRATYVDALGQPV